MDITLSWGAPNPTPAGGYRVSYWNKATPNDITTIAVASSPYTLTVPDGNYAGQVWSVCGFQNESPRQDWSINLPTSEPIVIGGNISGDENNLYLSLSSPLPCDTSFDVMYRSVYGDFRSMTFNLAQGETQGHLPMLDVPFSCFVNFSAPPNESMGTAVLFHSFSCGSQAYKLELYTYQACEGSIGNTV